MLTLTALVIVAGLSTHGRAELNKNIRQEAAKNTITVQDGRPVAKAITALEAKYGWVITYEDPRYVYVNDIEDVTESVRRDLYKYPKGGAPKVLVPKGGTLSFAVDVISKPNRQPDPRVIVQQMLTAQEASANGGKFRMQQGDKIIHVIPSAVRDKSGRLTRQGSLLDTVVNFPRKERTGLQTLEALCRAISREAQMPVIVGAVPVNLFMHHKEQYGTAGGKAREVLLQLFERIDSGVRLSWQLFYDPGMKMYVLNIHAV